MTLTPEIMGALALVVMWTATALITAAAARDLARLVRRRARLAPVSTAAADAGPVVGTITGAVASPGTLAMLSIDEVGRARAGRPAILFHPRKIVGSIEGGAVRLDDNTLVEVPPLGPEAAEVWRRSSGAISRPDLPFPEAHQEAGKARGFARTVVHPFAQGDRVTVGGRLVRADGALRIEPAADPTRAGETPTVLVSAGDPRRWYARKIWLSVVGIVGFLGSAALVTTLAFVGPPFGALATVAGVLGLAQFLGVQPLGVALRDAVAAPDRAVVHYDWVGSERPQPRA